MLDTYVTLHNTVSKLPELSTCEIFNARLILSYYENHSLGLQPAGEPLMHEEFLASVESRLDAFFDSFGFEEPAEHLGNKTPLGCYLESGVWPSTSAGMFGIFLRFYGLPRFGELMKVTKQMANTRATPVVLSQLLPAAPPHALLRMAESMT